MPVTGWRRGALSGCRATAGFVTHAHLHALAQHVVRQAEGLLQRRALTRHLQQLVVGDDLMRDCA